MSDLSTQLKNTAEAKFEQSVARLNLKETTEQNLFVPFNGGLFKATVESIAFLSTWPDDTLYLKDVYDRPIEVDRQELLVKMRQAYQTAMNTWHQEFAILSKTRRASDV